MTNDEYREALDELDRQIDLLEEFLRQRKILRVNDPDLERKLQAYIDERNSLLLSRPFNSLDEDLVD